MSTTLEQKTPFLAEILSGLIVWLAVWFFQAEYLALMTILLVAWIVVFRKGLIAAAGAFLISLALEFYNSGQTESLRLAAILILIGIAIDLALLLLLPVLRTRTLPLASTPEAAFFALIGFFIAYAIQINTCQIPLASPDGAVNLDQVFLKMTTCHQSYLLDKFQNFPPVESPQYWNEVAALVLRILVMAPFVWGALLVGVRRINFNPFRLAELPRYWGRAVTGIALSGFLTLIIWGLIFFVVSFGFPPFLPANRDGAAVFNSLSLWLVSIDLLISALGAGAFSN